jgi:hypothetical protein
MAKYSRQRVLTTMIETGLIPMFYEDNQQVAIDVVNACLAGVHTVLNLPTAEMVLIWCSLN